MAELAAVHRLKPGSILAMEDSHSDRGMLDGTYGFAAAAPANADPAIRDTSRRDAGLAPTLCRYSENGGAGESSGPVCNTDDCALGKDLLTVPFAQTHNGAGP